MCVGEEEREALLMLSVSSQGAKGESGLQGLKGEMGLKVSEERCLCLSKMWASNVPGICQQPKI